MIVGDDDLYMLCFVFCFVLFFVLIKFKCLKIKLIVLIKGCC